MTAKSRARKRGGNTYRKLWSAALIAGFALFLVLTIVVGYLAKLDPNNTADFRSFWLSLTASFLEDLAFFICVGVALFVVSKNSPSDETLDSRISSLLNGNRMSADLRRQMSLQIERHCAYSPRYKVEITYTGIDRDLRAGRAVVKNDRVIVNGFKDVSYEDRDAGYSIYTDRVEAAGDFQGEIMSVQTIESGKVEDRILNPIPIPAQGISETIPVRVAPDGESGFFYKYWIWHAFNEPFFTESRRLTSEVEVRILNQSDHTLQIKCHVHGHDFRLLKGQEHLYRLSSQQPGRRKIFTLVQAEEISL